MTNNIIGFGTAYHIYSSNNYCLLITKTVATVINVFSKTDIFARCLPETFYRVPTLQGVWWSPLDGARGEALWQKNGFRAFHRAKMSSQDRQLNTIGCVFL